MGRIFKQENNPKVEPISVTKDWNRMSFGEKVWTTAKEIPNTLYHFIPPSIREAVKEPTPKKIVTAIPKGAAEFGLQVAGVTAQAVGGAVLGAKELITKKEERVKIPYISEMAEKIGLKEIPTEISSYQTQKKDLVKQGFTDEEATALVGINSYIGLMPIVTKIAGLKPVKALGEKIATKEVPLAETPEGIKMAMKGKEVPETTVKVERPIFTKAKEIIGQTEEQQKFNQILEEHQQKFFEGRESLLSKEEPLNKTLVQLTEKELENYSKFTQGIEIPKNEITSNLKNAVELWKKVNAEEQNYLIEVGKLTKEQIENRRWKPVEMITGRTRQELESMGIDPQYYPYLAEDLLKKSDFIPTTGKRTKGGYLKRFTGKLLQEQKYITDPRIAIPRHRLQVFKDKMNNELVNSIRDTFAEQDKLMIKEYKANPKFAETMGVTEWKPSGSLRFYPTEKGVAVTKKVESYWLPKEIAKSLEEYYKPSRIEKLFRLTYDPLIDLWRVSVLNLVPRWLYNNLIGNIMLYTLGKGDPLALLFKAPKAFIQKKEFPKGVIQKEYAGGELPKVGRLGGTLKETSQFLRPIENWLNLLEQAKNYKALRIPATITQNLIRGYIALGKPIGFLNKVTENWFRAALYISKTEGKFLGLQLDKPVPEANGIKYVNEFLFDYSKLSRTERATFRRALPFWNWMKNITSFSLKFPVNHPTRALIVGALLQDYIDYINEVNQKEDKMKSVLRLKTEATLDGKPVYISIRSAMPFSDVFNTLPTNFEKFGKFLTSNPFSKIFIERVFRINSYTGQPFSQPYELQQFDEYGKPIRPLPSLPEHIGMQIPQVKMGQQIYDYLKYGKPLKRYETGEPKIYKGKVQTSDLLMEILGYFGVKLSATEYNKIQESINKKVKKQLPLERKYQSKVETALKRLNLK